MSQLHFTSEDWKVSEDRYWITFFNSISGPRSVVMIGTQDQEGRRQHWTVQFACALGRKSALTRFYS